MIKLVQVDMEFNDKLTTVLLNPSQIESIRRNPSGSCAITFKSGAIKGVAQSADAICKAGGIEIAIAGENEEEAAANRIDALTAPKPPKQPSAVYGTKGDEASATAPKAKKKVIDSKPPAAVVTGTRRKITTKKGSAEAGKKRAVKRARDSGRSDMGKGIEVTQQMAEPSPA